MELIYLGMQAHPAIIQSILAETRGAPHVVLPRGCIDHLQYLITYCPIHAEVWRFAWLPGLCVAYTWEKKVKVNV